MNGEEKLKQLTASLKENEKGVLATIEAISDDKSFIETDRFIGGDTDLGTAFGEGAVTGFIEIACNRAAVFATNGAVFKGGIGKAGGDKVARLINNAVKAEMPVIGIIDSAGARFLEGAGALEGYAKIYKALYKALESVPVIIVNKGKNYGLSSYFAYACHYCIGFENSELASSSPLIIAAAAGKDITECGTANVVKTKQGLYSTVVKTDNELKDAIKKLLKFSLSWQNEEQDDPNRTSKALKAGASAETLIKEIFDKNSFFSLKQDYAKEVVTGLAFLSGMPVGVVAFNKDGGVKLDSKGADKIGDLLYICKSFSLPVVSLVDVLGTVADIKEETSALIPEVANLMGWYTDDELTKITLITGSAVGAGYSIFCSKSNIDYLLAFADTRIGAVEGKAAAELLYAGEIAKSKNKETAAKKLSEAFEDENMSAIKLAKDGYIDNVISPSFARPYLVSAVRMFREKG